VAPVDVSSLRHERATRVGHHMPAHLRTGAYDVYRRPGYPDRTDCSAPLSYDENVARVKQAKARFER
jgi:formamidase